MTTRFLSVLFALALATGLEAAKARIQHHAQPVPGKYMVLLDEKLPRNAYEGIVTSLAATYNLEILARWSSEPRGFVCENVTDDDVARLADDRRVKLIEDDFSFSNVIASGMQWTSWNGNYLWHLDRLDEPTFWTHDSQYDMCPEGRAVYAYVIDKGVRADHEQFTLNEPSRVVLSLDFTDNSLTGRADATNGCTGPPYYNYDGWHGTAVASVIAGTTVGAAKTHVISLRVWDCYGNGYASWVVNAVRWVRSAQCDGSGPCDPYRNSAGVVNFSGAVPGWFTDDFATLNTTVGTLVTNTQIPFFTSADNFAGDACQFSPNSLAYTNVDHTGVVFTVGGTSLGPGTDWNDYRWQEWDGSLPRIGAEGGSNAGRCISLYAPACDIYAARTTGTTAYATISGTSFSSPLAAAVAARYMESSGVRNYQQVYDHLLAAACATGTVVNHVETVEYWMCRGSNGSVIPYYQTYRTDPGACTGNYVGINGTATPIHFPATSNQSGAGMLYSDMTCP